MSLINYDNGSGGLYGFNSYPFDKPYQPEWLEYVPEDKTKLYPCLIDAHGAGYTSHDVEPLNEGLARYLKAGNEPDYVGICIAGGKVVQPTEFCNMIAYALEHPNVDHNMIIIGGLSYGAIHTMNTMAYSSFDVFDILPWTNQLAGAYVLAGKVRGDYDRILLKRVPIICECGNNDTTTIPSSIASARKECDNIIFHNYVGLGHGGAIWDRFFTGGNINTAMTDWNGIPSDPFMSITEFIELCRNGSAPPPPPEPCKFTNEEICKLKEFAKTL